MGNRHWLIVVDEFSDCSHSFFLSRKSDQTKLLPMWIKRITLDNSGENKSLQKECNKENLGVIFEFTAPGTPQQNSVVERRIPTLMGRARAMLIQSGIDSKGKGEFWCEVISTATKLHHRHYCLSQLEHWNHHIPASTEHLPQDPESNDQEIHQEKYTWTTHQFNSVHWPAHKQASPFPQHHEQVPHQIYPWVTPNWQPSSLIW